MSVSSFDLPKNCKGFDNLCGEKNEIHANFETKTII